MYLWRSFIERILVLLGFCRIYLPFSFLWTVLTLQTTSFSFGWWGIQIVPDPWAKEGMPSLHVDKEITSISRKQTALYYSSVSDLGRMKYIKKSSRNSLGKKNTGEVQILPGTTREKMWSPHKYRKHLPSAKELDAWEPVSQPTSDLPAQHRVSWNAAVDSPGEALGTSADTLGFFLWTFTYLGEHDLVLN